jgi:hypothetical protein
MFQVASFTRCLEVKAEWPVRALHNGNSRVHAMTLLIVIILLLVLLGGGGGYYGYRTYGGPGLGGVLGLVLVVILILWLLGGMHT